MQKGRGFQHITLYPDPQDLAANFEKQYNLYRHHQNYNFLTLIECCLGGNKTGPKQLYPVSKFMRLSESNKTTPVKKIV